MYYFAALALLVASCDWRTIAAGAATVAVHHIVLNFFLPSLIYSGGSDFFRLAIHATILILEAGVLVWLASTLERMFGTVKAEAARAADSRATAEKSHADALKAAEEAEAARRLREQDQARIADEDHTTLQGLASALERLASGDLTCRITAPLPEKAETLRRDFNAAVEKLQTAMTSVLKTAHGIRSGTGEISAANDDLSRRTEQQAAGLEQSAAALDRITATVRHTAGDVVHARDVVGAAKGNAERASEVVRQAVDAMSGIEQSSRKISQIIGVIDEIAFQTNLLALNAGVEAARAGEAGRGFAVVASEVRALAQRSADAAKEIKALISTSGQQVAAGVGLVGETGGALREIAAQVAELAGVVAQIAASAQEQTSGLDQVNAAVRQMDQATQQNAAMVEETTAASHRLLKDNSSLSLLLGSFKVEAGAGMDRRAEAKLRMAG
jgi:methyl-accepting chemotaxis protein